MQEISKYTCTKLYGHIPHTYIKNIMYMSHCQDETRFYEFFAS